LCWRARFRHDRVIDGLADRRLLRARKVCRTGVDQSPNKRGDTTESTCEDDEGSGMKDAEKIGDQRDYENQPHKE
jgi:hypothetical protein